MSAATPSLISNVSVLLNHERVISLPPLAPSCDIQQIKLIVGMEAGIDPNSIVMYHNNRVLTDAFTLETANVRKDEMMEARTQGRAQPQPPAQQAPRSQPLQQPPSSQHRPSAPSTNGLGIPDAIFSDPDQCRQYIRSTPDLLFHIEAQNPQLYEAVIINDPVPFRNMWRGIVANVEAAREKEREHARLASADPFDPVVQQQIAEEIRLKNVQDNYEMAIEYAPESFGRVYMLYVPLTVNNVPLKAFVDSGAQSTIMSVECAERCGIMRLIDKRFAGMAKGIGSAKIIGRIHQVPCKIGTKHCSMSFTVLENQSLDFLFGLDQLKKHQAIIDLNKNCLTIQGEDISFLSEKDIPSSEKDEALGEPQSLQGSSSSSSSSSSSTTRNNASSSPPTRPAAAASSSASSTSSSTVAARPSPSTSPAASPSLPSQPSPPQSSSNLAAVAAAQRRMQTSPAAPPAAATPAATAQTAIPNAAPTPAAHTVPSPPAYSPTDAQISQLTELGFGREQCVQALLRFKGNVDQAAAFLFST